MSINWGFNFRQTSGFVTDGTNESPALGELYPHSFGNGATAGWTNNGGGTLTGRDRSSSVDRRLAGIVTIGSGATSTFQVDLPASGSYSIRLAMGDESFSAPTTKVVIKDGTTVLATIGSHNVAADQFYDTTDTAYSGANWPGSNTANTYSFAGSTLNVDLVGGASGAVIAHLFVSQVGGGVNVLGWLPIVQAVQGQPWTAVTSGMTPSEG